jgi:hypothetical protein
MNWEAFTGIATAFTGLIILATVFVGARQLQHLQRATQLQGIMRLIDGMESPAVLKAIEYVRFTLPEELKNPDYAKDLEKKHVMEDHPLWIALRWLERLGTLARYGLIDPEPLYALNSPDYQHMWAVLRPVVQARRRDSTLVPFDNAEYLCKKSWDWVRQEFGRETYDALSKKYSWEE